MEELRPYILLISKPYGITSFKFTEKVKKTLHAKKAGHTGTLDPIATGLMVIALNGATKFIPFINTETKEYVIEVRFGIETDTCDISGNITKKGGKIPTLSEMQRAIKHFTGKIRQTPPLYSAKKVNGKKLYEYARKGERVDVKEAEVTIYGIDILSFKNERVALRVLCTKGTYMRSLARDMGRFLGTYATLGAIARTKVGKFKIGDATFLSCIEKGIRKGFVPLKDALDFPELIVSGEGFSNGLPVKTDFVKVIDKNGKFIGIGGVDKGYIRPKRVLNENI